MPLDTTAGSSGVQGASRGVGEAMVLPRPHALILYGAIPLGIAMVMAWNPTGQRAPLMPGYLWAMLYWLGILWPLWVLLDACTRGLKFCFDALSIRVPLLALLVAACVLAVFPMRVYLIYYWALVDRLLYPAAAVPLTQLPGMFPENIRQFVGTLQRGGVLFGVWISVNYFYARTLRLPRYGHVHTKADGPGVTGIDPALARRGPSPVLDPAAQGQPRPQPVEPPPLPSAIAERLSRHAGCGLLALQAQDHYVRVVTTHGSELILYRFSDAVRELAPEHGLRVHRSFWVARCAMQRLLHRAGRHYLVLGNGERVPVSRTYLNEVRNHLQ